MTLRTLCLPLLLLPAILGCARKPAFQYDAAPGLAFSAGTRLSMDPRELVWKVEGKRAVSPWGYREAVLRELQARGFVLVDEEGDYWLDIIALAEGSEGRPAEKAAPAQQGMGGGGRKGKGMSGGGRGQKEAAPGERAPQVGGTLTVIVKLIARADERTVWYGSVEIPPAPKHDAHEARTTPEEWVRQLLAPLPTPKP